MFEAHIKSIDSSTDKIVAYYPRHKKCHYQQSRLEHGKEVKQNASEAMYRQGW